MNRFVCPASKLAEVDGVEAPISVVLDGGDEAWRDDPRVEAVETRGEPPPGTAVQVFLEREAGSDPVTILDAGALAKVRCGGASVPTVEELARFVRRCRELGLPFKATAGLHHAVRRDAQHGFLNVIAAALFGAEEEALADDDAARFSLDEGSFSWSGREARAPELERFRRDVFVGFGSCSAQEPADELRALGFL